MYQPSKKIDHFLIAGFQYHDGDEVLEELRVGTQLELVAEPDNPYDPCAVAIVYRGVLLGYVPRDKNSFLSQMLHFGHKDVVGCKVIQVDERAHPSEQVRVKLYFVDKRSQEQNA